MQAGIIGLGKMEFILPLFLKTTTLQGDARDANTDFVTTTGSVEFQNAFIVCDIWKLCCSEKPLNR